MKKTLLLIILFTAFAHCNYSKYRYGFFEGNWVCINYLDTVQKYRSVYKANHMAMQEIYFKRFSDTLYWLTNGVEQQKYAFEHITSNHIKLVNTADTTSFFLNEYAYYLSYDKHNTRFVFVKPDELLVDSFSEEISWPVSSQRVINSLVLGGIYRQDGNNKPVQFYTYGKVSGTPLFDNYRVCYEWKYRNSYDGDLMFVENENKGVFYAFEWNNKIVKIFSLLETALPDKTITFKKNKLVLSLTKLK